MIRKAWLNEKTLYILQPSDFHKLVNALLVAPADNAAVECYSRAPIDKPNLLAAKQEEFGLHYEITDTGAGINAMGTASFHKTTIESLVAFANAQRKTILVGVSQILDDSLA